MAQVRWLHLSDFHAGKHRYGERKMFSRIRSHVKAAAQAGWIPHFIAISGDLAFSGQPKEYALIKKEFIDLLIQDLTPLGWIPRIYTVPGNHDVDREADFATRESIIEKSKNIMQPTKHGQVERKKIIARFKGYRSACTVYSGAKSDWLANSEPAYTDRFHIDGVEIGISGINTAWLSQDDHDRNHLMIGYDLVEASLEKLSGCTLKILIGHHPISWLDDNDAAHLRRALGRHRAIYLHGHLHKAQTEQQVFRNHQFLTVQAAAGFQAYDDEIWVNGLIKAEVDSDAQILRLQGREWHPLNEWVYASNRFHPDDADLERPNWFRYDLPLLGRTPEPPPLEPTTGRVSRQQLGGRGGLKAAVERKPVAMRKSAAVTELHRLDAEDLVSALLSGRIDDGMLEDIASNEEKAARCLRGLCQNATDTWQRLLFAEISARATGPVDVILELAFDQSLHWGQRTSALSALRFVKGSDRSIASERLMSHASADDSDIDDTRLAIAGFGYLGEMLAVSTIVEDNDAHKSRYYIEKLGPYWLWAALSSLSIYPKSKSLDYFIWHIKESVSVLRKISYEISPFDVHGYLQLLPKSAAPTVLDQAYELREERLLLGLLFALDGRCSPYSLDTLMRIARDANLDNYMRGAALRVVASLANVEALEATTQARTEALPWAGPAHSLAIGWYRDVPSSSDLLAALGAEASEDEGYLNALWAAGQLAPSAPALIQPLLAASSNSKESLVRAHGWLGLAKAGVASGSALRDAAEIATHFVEDLIIGIAGLLAGEPKLLEAGIHASQREHQPVWRLQGHVYADLRRGLAQNAGEPGRLMLSMLNRGDLS